MNRRLKEYLDKKGAEVLDEGILKAYTTSMTERTIPEAKKQVRKNEERAAKLRFSPNPASRRQKTPKGKN